MHGCLLSILECLFGCYCAICTNGRIVHTHLSHIIMTTFKAHEWCIISWHPLMLEGTLDRFGYESILTDHRHPYILMVFPGEDGISQQDNAICHTARNVQHWLEEHDQGFQVLPVQSSTQLSISGTILIVVVALWILPHTPSSRCGMTQPGQSLSSCCQSCQRRGSGHWFWVVIIMWLVWVCSATVPF